MQNLPPPPAPKRKNDFPVDTEDQILYEKDLKPISSIVPVSALASALPFPVLLLADPTIERVQTTKLTVKGRWEKLFFTTLNPGEEFTHSITVRHGVTSSKSQTTEFGTDIGAKSDIASIDAKLKRVIQSTYTVTDDKTETYQIKKLVKKNTTVCWWHEVLTFETSGTISEYACIKILGSKKQKRVKLGRSRHYVHDFVVEQPTFAETSFPE